MRKKFINMAQISLMYVATMIILVGLMYTLMLIAFPEDKEFEQFKVETKQKREEYKLQKQLQEENKSLDRQFNR